MSVYATSKIEVQLSVGVWTNISTDVFGEVAARYGIANNGPADCVAETGQISFKLNNSSRNSGSTLGWYSPASSSVRSGWTYGIPVRWTVTYSGVDYVRFRGKVGSIDPVPGRYQAPYVNVVGYDGMRDLMTADARQTTVQVNKLESELLTALLDALPTDSQPVARNIATGIDTYPYAFDDVGSGTKAASVVVDIVTSGLGRAYFSGDGTFTYKTRNQLEVLTSSLTLSDTMVDLRTPSNLDGVYNRIRVTIHPKTIDTAATTRIWAQTGAAPVIPAGATVTIWGSYYNPTNPQMAIGGTSQVTPIVATTDYTGNSLADGSGLNRTSDISVATTAFGSTVMFAVTNSGGLDLFLTSLGIRGKGIYDNGPQTFEKYTAKTYGDRPIAIDQPYQDDVQLGQATADYLYLQYSSLTANLDSVTVDANSTAALMVQALTREPTDMITVSETATGLSSVKCIIRSVETRWGSAKDLRVTWGLAPGPAFDAWELGVAGFSELGATTLLGF